MRTFPKFGDDAPSGDWAGRESDLERRLEGWVEAIARMDARAGVHAALACVQTALPVAQRHADDSRLDFGAPDQSWGGSKPPVEQVAHVRAWLEAGVPIPAHTADYGRQLHVWEEDLRPVPTYPADWFTYCVEATNLLVMAVLHDQARGPSGQWPGPVCAARSAVCAFKAMHGPERDRKADVLEIESAVRTALAAAGFLDSSATRGAMGARTRG